MRKRLWPSQSSCPVYRPSFCSGRDKTTHVDSSPQAKLVCSLKIESQGGEMLFHSTVTLQREMHRDPRPAAVGLPSSACPGHASSRAR